jgi:hypothetical protein
MKPRTYWHTLTSSLTSPGYYQEVLRAPFHFSLRFFLLSVALIGLIIGYHWTNSFSEFIREHRQAILQDAVTHFPAEGHIVWNGDRLSASPDPFIIYTPGPFKQRWPRLPDHLAVITNNTDTSPGEISRELGITSLAMLSPNTLHLRGKNEWAEFSLQRLLQDQLLLINQTTLERHLHVVTDWIDSTLPVLQFVGPLTTALALILHRLWIALIESILVFLLFRINQIAIPFAKSYQLALHLLVPAEIVHQVTKLLYPNLEISLLSLTFWILLIFLFFSQRHGLREQFAASTKKK